MRSEAGNLPRPDPTLHQTGSDGFDGNRGQDELRLLEHFGMRPSSHVLDIGCGIGRLAHECASYLDDDATYTGLDIAPVVIDWLNDQYAPRLPGFRFDLLDVHSPRYRPDGARPPEQVRLPYDDHQFDVACAFEVFMHLPLDGIRNYLHEIARVLRPGGLAVVTLVAMYPGERDLEQDHRPYVQVADGVHTLFPNRTNVSMAYDLQLVRTAIADAGLDEVGHIKGRLHSWRDRREKVRRERRGRLIGEQLAQSGVDVAELIRERGPVGSPDAPTDAPELDDDPLSHNCDLFALRTRASSA